MSFELFISLRYLKAKRKQTFISIITLISVGGVMLGVMTLIVVLSVMSGFEQDLKSKILAVNSDVVFMRYKDWIPNYLDLVRQIEAVPKVVAATPFIYSQVMVRNEQLVSGAVLRGVDVNSVDRVIRIGQGIVAGTLQDLVIIENGVILGRELARNLGVGPGDQVDIISPLGRRTPLGRAPQLSKHTVVGLLESGMFEYDSTFVVMSLATAQKFLGMGDQVTGMEIKVVDIYSADRVAQALREKFPHPYWIRDWMGMNRNLFSALKLEKITMFIILTLIILVAAFNIVGTLIMVVMEKTKDIAILKSMGAASKSILKIFILEGLFIGGVGTMLGLLGGITLCELLKKYKFIKLPSDVYYISTFPVKMQFFDITLICTAAVLITFLATLYPSWQAAKLDPAEALRYE
jgi:lipoprotein-releasing system permease protein